MGHPDSVETGFHVNRRSDLPRGYGDNRVTLMVRDPWTFYAYWEIKQDIEASVREKIHAKGLTPLKSILRVYDVTGNGRDDLPKIETDFELKDWANSWYVHVKGPGREWMVDIGIVCTDGEFFGVARSNVIKTPSNSMSNLYDEDWMFLADLYAPGDVGKSSLEFSETMERYLRKWLFSGGISSGEFGSADLFTDKK